MLFIFSVCLHNSLWNSFRNTVCTASLNSRKRGSVSCSRTLQVLGTGRHKGCFHFFTVLKNSCVKGFVLIFFFYVFIITLVPRCPPLFKCKLSSLGPGCGACGGRQLTSDHIGNVPRSAPSPTVFQFSLVVNTGMFIR